MRCSLAKLRWGRLGLGAAASVLLIAGSLASSQTHDTGQMQQPQSMQQPPSMQQPLPPFGEAPNHNDPMQRQRLEKMEKARNSDRQKQLQRDTDKLLTLAKELKDDVDKSNEDTLSVDVVKKAAAIEKLAKSVKDRMRG